MGMWEDQRERGEVQSPVPLPVEAHAAFTITQGQRITS